MVGAVALLPQPATPWPLCIGQDGGDARLDWDHLAPIYRGGAESAEVS